MSKILVINGPNLGHLGKRDVHIYGTENMDTVAQNVLQLNNAPNLEFYQSNHEGAIIDRLEAAREEYLKGKIMGIVLNAGAFTHTSLAMADCLSWIKVPFVEVHISNILARSGSTSQNSANSGTDAMRGQSLFAVHSLGLIAGFGVESYVLAVEALIRYTTKTNPNIKN